MTRNKSPVQPTMNSADERAAKLDVQRKEIARKLGYGSWQQFEALAHCNTIDAVFATIGVMNQGKQEAVARAICRSNGDDDNIYWEIYKNDADAAIAALEPTQ